MGILHPEKRRKANWRNFSPRQPCRAFSLRGRGRDRGVHELVERRIRVDRLAPALPQISASSAALLWSPHDLRDDPACLYFCVYLISPGGEGLEACPVKSCV